MFSTNRCHFIFTVIHTAFLLSSVDLLQPCGDRVSRFIYGIHIYHWLIQQYNDTCCFVLFASEIANKLFHIRKEILWYRRGFLLCSFFFLWLWVWLSDSPAEQGDLRPWWECQKNTYVAAAQWKKTLVGSTALSPLISYGPSVEKNPHKKIPSGTTRKSLALPINACRVAVCVACA